MITDGYRIQIITGPNNKFKCTIHLITNRSLVVVLFASFVDVFFLVVFSEVVHQSRCNVHTNEIL